MCVCSVLCVCVCVCVAYFAAVGWAIRSPSGEAKGPDCGAIPHDVCSQHLLSALSGCHGCAHRRDIQGRTVHPAPPCRLVQYRCLQCVQCHRTGMGSPCSTSIGVCPVP